MRFGVLGPLEVWGSDGAARPVAGAKARLLLALLLLRANQPVSGDALSDALWDGKPPPTARGTLQAYVSRLRRLLKETTDGGPVAAQREAVPAPVRLQGSESGYRLVMPVADLDSLQFEQLFQSGTKLLPSQPKRAAEMLGAALHLWRGPALLNVRHVDWADHDLIRLEEQRIAAVEAQIEARLAFGEDAVLVGHLRGLVSAHPYRERLHELLMIALYRSGCQAEALHVYRRAYRILRDEIGVTPGDSLVRLERAIVTQDPVLYRRAADGVRPGPGLVPPDAGGLAGPPAASVRLAALADGAVAQAADWAKGAGDEAMQALGFPEAVAHYRRAVGAVALLDPPPRARRGRLLISLARAQQAAYELSDALGSYTEAARAALEAGDDIVLGQAACGLATASEYGMGDQGTVDLLGSAADDLDWVDVRTRTYLLAGLARSLPPADPRARWIAGDAVQLALRSGDSAGAVVAMGTEILVSWGPADPIGRARRATAVVDDAQRLGFPDLSMEARNWRASALQEIGEHARSEDDLDALRTWAPKSRRPFFMALDTLRGVESALRTGDLDAAQAILGQPSPAASPNFSAGFAAQRFFLRREQGRIADSLPELREAAMNPCGHAAWRAALAVAFAETGAEAKARVVIDAALSGLRTARQDWLWLGTVALLADAAITVRHCGAAAPLYALLRPFTGQCVVLAHGVAQLGAVESYLGGLAVLLGGTGEARRHLESALDLELRAHAPTAAARTERRLGILS